ncbi:MULTISPECIES: 4-alpha-glucanotransferase [unclassified Streptomyces]|uniref:4-alpha-glucanotransferase n=1 Tax=unclassified Streptomyces TaxID=2593676 RepID=UPI0022B6D022|nr:MULTISPECIES: 4-alpha-glucanotransferase [unclassified Streptomyces]MCZ7414244.1 4-alpha-glucanotransferase [Streptomyces sp. WMMC897]MCZ7431262.1 4-alpha-glucanotransferase [Streptomyces sp. WMMC1477]
MGRLARLAAAHGVATSYAPGPGRVVDVPEDSVVAVLAALGIDASTPEAVRQALEAHELQAAARLLPPTVVLRSGQDEAPHDTGPGLPGLPALPPGTVLRVETEDGAQYDAGPGLPVSVPAAVPPGVHTLRAEAPDGRSARAPLIVAPQRLPRPRGRSHGLMVQLYSVLSGRSWGMGDLADLADLAAWAGRTAGAGFVQLNPLHAAVPAAGGEGTDPSPYRPSSRRFADPVHLRVEDVPEYAYLAGAERDRMERLTERAARLRGGVLHKGAHIDRDAVWALKLDALELLRTVPLSPGRRADYCAYLADGGQELEDHALWCTLAELHGPDWRSWPAGLDDPRSARTARARTQHLERVDFHCWLSWLVDGQLARAQEAARGAGMSLGLVHDLAVGVHPSGSDAWAQQDALAAGMSVGAPPDAFNAAGQCWGLPPWRPDALAATGYRPYRELLRGLLAHAGALRVDHVMGHFRQWWVPEGRPPAEGTYVRYDAQAMLGVLTLEAHRAGAAVIGEDLGTVEDGVREELADRGVLGTSVLWFERDYTGDGKPLAPDRWRASCLATATTHDLPSTAARLAGDHVGLQHRLGLLQGSPRAERAAAAAERAEWLALFARLGLLAPGHAEEEAAIRAVYRFLAATPAWLIGVWLPDGVGDRRPQNVPGTSLEYPNWRLPVADGTGRPVALEELLASPRLHALLTGLRTALEEDGVQE